MTTAETAPMNQTPVVSLHSAPPRWGGFLFYISPLDPFSAYPTCFPLTQFTCANGRCININWRCDNGNLQLPLPLWKLLF